jgi:glycerol kinase
VPDFGGVVFVPAFAGLGAPPWIQFARGTIFGLTRGTNAGHIARAAIESMAYQTMDVLKAMNADAGLEVKEIRVDGGATVNNNLMQFQSDVLNCKVIRPSITETTALGAAYLAGLAIGFWESTDEIQRYWEAEREFQPQMKEELRKQYTGNWNRAVKAVQHWADNK